ncbi:MAG: hypothetical protein H6604_03105 [Flavobacteriales bacterium]|nr:hypothetical protein [Flavobacteriales bacterium]
MKFFFSILFLTSCAVFSFAQNNEWKNPNERIIPVDSSEIKLQDFEAILLETIELYDKNNVVLDSTYTIDRINEKIIFNENLENHFLKYYINPNLITKKVFENDSILIVKTQQKRILTDVSFESENEKKIFNGINSKGTLIRGITFGNNQSASVQSSLDLELSGKLTDKVQLNAVISDHNIPIQSDGYSQTLNQFDRVYVELAHKRWNIKAGYLDLMQQEHFFSKFNQKVIGLQVGGNWKSKNFSHSVNVAGSVSRGEFVNFHFIGQEANQGPYKLQGKNGEKFIVILADSERIYLNGFLLTRGEENDYTINYNTGEITFSNNRLMTANSRITAEYIYTNQNYNRFLTLFQSKHESENLVISTQYFSEGDQRNNPVNQNLNQSDIEVLKNAGNNQNLMYNTSVQEAEYDENRVLYRKQIIAGQEIYEFSTNQDEQLYSISFLEVGENKGDYVLTNSSVNGRVFEYVNPISGVSQGNYAPIKRLNPPTNKKVFSTNSKFNAFNTKVEVDLAYSNKDENLFSKIDNDSNHGFAGKISVLKEIQLEKVQSKNRIDLQFIQKNFAIINRINAVEFNRDFNLSKEFSNQNQTRIQFVTENTYKNLQAQYSFNYLNEQTIFSGIKNDINLNYDFNFARLNSEISVLNSENNQYENQNKQKTTFVRFNNNLEKEIKNQIIGISYRGEKNTFKDTNTKELSQDSFSWNELSLYNRIKDSANFYINSRLYVRKDDSVRLNSMKRINTTLGGVISSQLIKNKNQNLFTELHYRNVNYNQENKDENILLSTTSWNKKWINQAIQTNVLYELGSGKEAQREFSYLKVTDGQGVYKWTDFNENGIEELDEFAIAEFNDLARYNRVFTGNIRFLLINKNKLNLSLNVFPSKFSKSNVDFWKRITFRNSYLLASSFTKNKSIELNPFREEDVLFRNSSFLSHFEFNQITIHKWSLSLKSMIQQNSRFLFLGLETQKLNSKEASVNYKVKQNHIFTTSYSDVKNSSESENYSNRRYNVNNKIFQFTYNYKISDSFQTSFYYKNQDKRNTIGNESLKWNELNAELRWNDSKNKNTNILLSTSYIKNEFTGNSYSLVANQMLEGLRSGNSFLWTASIQRNLTSYLQLNLNYQGRKTENNSVIHIGNVQLQANL